MKNLNLKLPLLLVAVSFFSYTSLILAQTKDVATTSTSKEQVEVSLPIQKDDFLLFYGITQDSEVNTKILDLRKDFTKKFETLKKQYQDSLIQTVGDLELTPMISLTEDNTEIKTAPQTISLKSVKIDTDVKPKTLPTSEKSASSPVSTQNEKVNNSLSSSILQKDEPKKYILTNIKENVITPLVNIVNDTPQIKIESSSWFQKIKSWFGW